MKVQSLSITDHDTLAAYRLLGDLPDNLQLVPGIELSCQWSNRGIHIVGLNVDTNSDAMIEAESTQLHARHRRAEMIAEKLEKYGVQTPLEGALRYSDGGAIGRPHFARHMAETGFVRDINQAFKRFLGNGKACDIKVHWPDIKTAVRWIREAGGVAVLAHPGKYDLTRTKLVELTSDFVAVGGQGLEVVSGRQTPAQTRDYAAICQQFGLSASWGSDFHNPGQTWIDLGQYSRVPDSLPPIWQHWQ
jgi:3',5'-nucleoside bisphosphate phosphatase